MDPQEHLVSEQIHIPFISCSASPTLHAPCRPCIMTMLSWSGWLPPHPKACEVPFALTASVLEMQRENKSQTWKSQAPVPASACIPWVRRGTTLILHIVRKQFSSKYWKLTNSFQPIPNAPLKTKPFSEASFRGV